MNFKILMFSILLIVTVNSTAQSRKNSSCDGIMLSSSSTKQPICWRRDTFQNNTTYTISRGGLDIYVVDFYVFPKQDSISVKFYDKSLPLLETRNIKFDKNQVEDIVIRNYRLYELPISFNSEFDELLISIPKLENLFVTLHQFKAIDKSNTYFLLKDIDLDLYSRYRQDTERHKAWEDKIAREKIEHANDVWRIKNNMLQYKESRIKDLQDFEQENLSRTTNLINAPGKNQKDFEKIMDELLPPYYNKIFPFENHDIQLNLTFKCNGAGKIDSVHFLNDKTPIWFLDSFRLKLKPKIEAGIFEAGIDKDAHPELFQNFLSRYQDSIKWVRDKWPERPDDLQQVINDVEKDFNKYMDLNRVIKGPVLYTYQLNYKSRVSETSLVVRDDIKVKSGNPLTESQQRLFREKIFTPDKKKYTIKICTVNVNNELPGEDIKMVTQE